MFVFSHESWLWVFETEVGEVSDEEKQLSGLFLPSASQWHHKFYSPLESFDEADSLQELLLVLRVTWKSLGNHIPDLQTLDGVIIHL